jgi:hypothetical protein
MALSELMQQGRTHPQNAWSQAGRTQAAVAGGAGGAAGASSSSGGPAATASKGQWKAGGKLAKQMGAISDAYGGR